MNPAREASAMHMLPTGLIRNAEPWSLSALIIVSVSQHALTVVPSP